VSFTNDVTLEVTLDSCCTVVKELSECDLFLIGIGFAEKFRVHPCPRLLRSQQLWVLRRGHGLWLGLLSLFKSTFQALYAHHSVL
jgi:hypothetical protein